MPTPQTILDTSVVASGLLTPGGSAGRILEGVFRDAVPLVISHTLLGEYRRTLGGHRLASQHHLALAELDEFVERLHVHAASLIPDAAPASAPDPRDQHLWDLLFAVPGAILVTGERRLLDRPPPGREVLSPREFADRYLAVPDP